VRRAARSIAHDLSQVSLEELQSRFGEESIWVYNIIRGIDHTEGSPVPRLYLTLPNRLCTVFSRNGVPQLPTQEAYLPSVSVGIVGYMNAHR
jgi:hypothetical protein